MRLAIILVTALGLSGCATIGGVPQTPCQRATRAADTAHAAIAVAIGAGVDPIVIAKLQTAAVAADAIAVGICAATVPAPPGI